MGWLHRMFLFFHENDQLNVGIPYVPMYAYAKFQVVLQTNSNIMCSCGGDALLYMLASRRVIIDKTYIFLKGIVLLFRVCDTNIVRLMSNTPVNILGGLMHFFFITHYTYLLNFGLFVYWFFFSSDKPSLRGETRYQLVIFLLF